MLAEIGCASREGRAYCLWREGKGTGGRREQLMEPWDAIPPSRVCNVSCSYGSAANSSLNLKAAQVYRHKAFPDCHPNIGHEEVGNSRGNQVIQESHF